MALFQDQFVHDATLTYSSAHSVAKRPYQMHSVYEDAEDGSEEEGVAWSSARNPMQERGERVKGKRKRHSSGEDHTQPSYPPKAPYHPHLSSSMFSFSQPGEPELKTTHTLSQSDHTHQWAGRRERVKRVEKDAMTGEHRHSRTSFSPHRHSNHHHLSNVELTGHQPLTASRSHGYGMEYGNGTFTHGPVTYSRIGMGPVDSSSSHVASEIDDTPVDWEVRSECV